MKKETLEEAAERYAMETYPKIEFKEYTPEMMLDYAKISTAVEFGAKWNAERSYSEEDVIDFIKYTIDNFFNGKLAGLNSNEIFEQFKNK